MNRQELYDQIKESARRADIPDSLKPEHIAFKLQPYQKKQKHMIYFPFKKTVSLLLFYTEIEKFKRRSCRKKEYPL